MVPQFYTAAWKKILIFINISSILMFSSSHPAISSDYTRTASASLTASFKFRKFLTAYDFNDADIPFIASNFDIIDTSVNKVNQIKQIKNLNPFFKAIFYKDALTHREGTTKDLEDWYVHDAQTGSRLVNKDWGWYLMDIGKQSYGISLANHIRNNLATHQIFDGVLLDDVWDSVSSDRFYRERTKETGVVPQPIINSWHNNMKILLMKIRMAIGKRLLIINTGYYNTDYIVISDGLMYEAFCHANWQPYEEYYADWRKAIDRMIRVTNLGKIYLAQSGILDGETDSQIKRTARYCFAMFLLGANNNSYFYFKPTMKYQGVTYFPEWDIDIGTPIEDYHARPGTPLFKREYSKGLVVINPSSGSVQIDLAEKYKNLDGIVTDVITLGSHEGEVLTKSSEDTNPGQHLQKD